LKQYGESIYGTRGNIIPPQPWGVLTGKEKSLFAHILVKPALPYLFIPSLSHKVVSATLMNGSKPLKIKQQEEGVFVYLEGIVLEEVDTIIRLETN